MIAKKCDVCGALYEAYSWKTPNYLNPNGFVFLSITNSQTYTPHSIQDCCPNCMSKLKRFIYELKGKNG